MLPWVSSIVAGPAGLRDLEAEEAERARAQVEAERRELAHAERRAARVAQLPALEAEAAAEARLWVGANIMQSERTAP
jgi:hypothetical protein